MSVRPTLGAVAVVIHKGAALLIKRKTPPNAGKWSFPGGSVEPGETGLEAAVRELQEETGVIATADGYLTNRDVIVRDEGGTLLYHYLLAMVPCTYVSGTPRASSDAADAKWVPLAEVASLDLTEGVPLVLSLLAAGDTGAGGKQA